VDIEYILIQGPGTLLTPVYIVRAKLRKYTEVSGLYKYYINPYIQTELGYRVFNTSQKLSTQTELKNVNYLSLAVIFRF